MSDLKRFRGAIAEILNIEDICPECNSELKLISCSISDGPGGIATMLPYFYCEHCNLYYIYKVKDEEETIKKDS